MVAPSGCVGVQASPDMDATLEVRVADLGQQVLEGWRRHGLEGEGDDLIALAGRLQLDRLDGARSDVEADDRFRFSETKHGYVLTESESRFRKSSTGPAAPQTVEIRPRSAKTGIM